MKRGNANAAERRHMARVAAMGCIVCLESLGLHDSPAEVHHVHVRHGWGRSSHFATIPLCAQHHRLHRYAVHNCGAEAFERAHGVSETDFLELVSLRLGVARVAA
jgi:hypothetical protein